MYDREKTIDALREKGVSEDILAYTFDERNHNCPLLYHCICELKKSGVIQVDDETFEKSMTNIAKVLID